MSYSNEIKQFVIDTYNNFYSIKAIQSILRKKEGMDISATTIYRWLNEAGIKLDGSNERKAESEEVIIHGPTGQARIYYALFFSILAVLVGGIILIKKKVLAKK